MKKVLLLFAFYLSVSTLFGQTVPVSNLWDTDGEIYNSVKTDKNTELAGSLEFVGISPNPTNGLTNIQVQATGVVNGELIMVINLNGKVMAEHQLTKGENSYTLDATNWAAGMYIATYSANGAKPVTRTFIVQ